MNFHPRNGARQFDLFAPPSPRYKNPGLESVEQLCIGRLPSLTSQSCSDRAAKLFRNISRTFRIAATATLPAKQASENKMNRNRVLETIVAEKVASRGGRSHMKLNHNSTLEFGSYRFHLHEIPTLAKGGDRLLIVWPE